MCCELPYVRPAQRPLEASRDALARDALARDALARDPLARDAGALAKTLYGAHNGYVYEVGWARDDSALVTASADGTAKV